VVDVREICEGQTVQAAAAMLTLRPRWKTSAALVEFIDTRLRPTGYRLFGVFEDDLSAAVSVIGFREMWSTAWGHCLYVDDVSTVRNARGRGYADVLMQWAIAEAERLNCEAVHLDSGVGEERSAVHRLYMRNHLQITAHHFARAVQPGE
jgi:GNAT superfamily N-acetyltransferase